MAIRSSLMPQRSTAAGLAGSPTGAGSPSHNRQSLSSAHQKFKIRLQSDLTYPTVTVIILQPFKPEFAMDPSLRGVEPYPRDTLKELAAKAAKFVRQCYVRGEPVPAAVE